ncbi:ATP-binding protein [Deinococcus aquiradiocola]|uniref:histidine kinase n=1 Tax=Deinococcus aquiradiocola TaxID=393059 RepID=A0A917UNB0_9DEIO|nr:ATP-binding protein [Deinococcus aquiradiocola]GGJ70177.1 histidine kinase [Deinococcus aquiradiocola]
MTEPTPVPARLKGQQDVDLTSCDREPIHVPGSIQPHGAMLVLQQGRIVQASANTADLFGLEVSALLGQPLTALLAPDVAERVLHAERTEDLRDNPLYLLSARVQERGPYDVIAHRRGEQTVLEFEGTARAVSADVYPAVKRSLTRLSATGSVQECCEVAAREVQALTGFDRVMVYRFAEDGTGTVVAEAASPAMTPYLGLRYPASDIPRQARAMYVKSMLRIISDARYTPVPMLALPDHDAPLDMTYSVLRSVSPIHLEYLANMGVAASMSISLLDGDQLWGLIACHHATPRLLPYDVRSGCEFLGQFLSVQLSAKAEQQLQTYRLQLKSAQAKFVELMAEERDLVEGLIRHDFNLLDFVDAPGAAICLNSEVVLLGVTPTRDEVRALTEWLSVNADAEVLHTSGLPDEYPPAQAYADVASGLLSVQISRGRRDYVMWFRPEELQTVLWGGDPTKVATPGPDGQERLSPRKSFAAWQETVRGRSRDWQQAEVLAAQELRHSIISVVLRSTERVSALNEELERSNTELDSFAYIASHDLKEPLRGLHNYSTFLMEAYEHRLDEDGVSKLRTLVRLTQRMEDLIDSLLLYSRVGRVDLSFINGDVGVVARDAVDILRPRLEQDGVEIRWHGTFPSMPHDRVRLLEVFSNLVANAVKYTDKPERFIELGALAPDERGDLRVPDGVSPQATILYVRDNGIGIQERHFENIFRIFKRLHARDQFGGGTGAGLTIARKIVERHGGQLWVNSVYGQGSTFCFTLEA